MQNFHEEKIENSTRRPSGASPKTRFERGPGDSHVFHGVYISGRAKLGFFRGGFWALLGVLTKRKVFFWDLLDKKLLSSDVRKKFFIFGDIGRGSVSYQAMPEKKFFIFADIA